MKKLVVNARACTGCRLCESVCAIYNDRINNPSRSRIRISKKHILGLSTPNVCRQCKNPPCAKVCPVNAVIKDDSGLVHVDYDACIGCEDCTGACPFGVMMVLDDRVVKCELCDGDPQCVKYCATQAIIYEQPESAVQRKRSKFMAQDLESV